MKQKLIVSFAALLLQQAITFCQTNPLVKYLPDNVSMVMSFNPLKLGNQIPGETFRQSVVYRELMKKDDGELRAFLSEPSVSGIDFSYDLMLVVTTDTSVKYSGSSVHLFGVLKNEALFSLAVKKIAKGKDSVRTYGTDRILLNENSGSGIAWNNDVFVLNMSPNRQMNTELYNTLADTLSQEDAEKRMQKIKESNRKTQKELFFHLLTRKPGNVMASNNQFINIINTPGDIKMWNNGMPNPVMGKVNPLADIFGKLQQFSGTAKTSVINFENGKITAKGQNYINAKMADIYSKYPPAVLNTDLSRRLPKGKLLALVNFSYHPEMAGEMMSTGFGSMLDDLKKEIPFDLSLMKNVFGSSIMLAVVKSEDMNTVDSITRKMDGMQVIIAMPIEDKARFEKLKTTTLHFWDSVKTTEKEAKMFKGFNPAVKTNDSLFVFSLSSETATAFLNNPGTGAPPEWLQSYTNHPMMVTLNLKELFDIVFSKKTAGPMGADEKKIFDMFDQLLVYGGEYENGSITNTIEMKFSNQTDNALKQVFELINTAAEKSGKMKMSSDEKGNPPEEEVTLDALKIDEKKRVPPPPPAKPSNEVKVQPKKKTKG
jgi:hypothetical protein